MHWSAFEKQTAAKREERAAWLRLTTLYKTRSTKKPGTARLAYTSWESSFQKQGQDSYTQKTHLKTINGWHIILTFLIYLFIHRVSVQSPAYSGTHYVDLASLKLTEILLPSPPSAGIKCMHCYAQQGRNFEEAGYG